MTYGQLYLHVLHISVLRAHTFETWIIHESYFDIDCSHMDYGVIKWKSWSWSKCIQQTVILVSYSEYLVLFHLNTSELLTLDDALFNIIKLFAKPLGPNVPEKTCFWNVQDHQLSPILGLDNVSPAPGKNPVQSSVSPSFDSWLWLLGS